MKFRAPISNFKLKIWLRSCRSYLSFLFFTPILLGACASPEPTCPLEGNLYPQFCDYYLENQIALGRPISDYFFEENDETGASVAVQYFEGMRLEYHANLPASERIVPTPLGLALLNGEPNYESVVEGPFEEIYDLLGEEVLGRPISNEKVVADRKVQYFENTRLRFEPSLPTVINDTLGQAHMQKYYPGLTYRPNLIIDKVLPVNINAHLSTPVSYADEPQWLFIQAKSGDIVLSDAQVSIKYRPVDSLLADGLIESELISAGFLDTEIYVIGQTDSNGLFFDALSLPDSEPGKKMMIEVTLDHQSVGKSSVYLSYVSWW